MYYIGNMKDKITHEFDELTFKDKTISKNSKKININQNDVVGYFISKSKEFNGGGGFIHCPKKFSDKYVCVIVLKGKIK